MLQPQKLFLFRVEILLCNQAFLKQCLETAQELLQFSLTAQMQPIFFACQLCRAQKAKDQKSCPSSWRNRRCCARPLLRYGSVSEVSL